MVDKLIKEELGKYKKDIDSILDIELIDCVTIFPNSEKEYTDFNRKLLKQGKIIEKMNSGNLFYIQKPIFTSYGKLFFIKVRKYDEMYSNYKISVDFIVKDYLNFKNSLENPIIKTYESFELVQLKNNTSFINIVSISAREEYRYKI